MVPIATQIVALSALVSAGNLIANDNANSVHDEPILVALTVLEQDLVTLPNSATILSTTPCVASASWDWRIHEKMKIVLRMALARGYAVGD